MAKSWKSSRSVDWSCRGAEFKPDLRAEGYSRVTFELEQQGESVKLTVIHEIDKPDSRLIKILFNGWPHLLASLKSLLETEESLVETRRWPKGLRAKWRRLSDNPLSTQRQQVTRFNPRRLRGQHNDPRIHEDAITCFRNQR